LRRRGEKREALRDGRPQACPNPCVSYEKAPDLAGVLPLQALSTLEAKVGRRTGNASYSLCKTIIRPLTLVLPNLNTHTFALHIFAHSPLLAQPKTSSQIPSGEARRGFRRGKTRRRRRRRIGKLCLECSVEHEGGSDGEALAGEERSEEGVGETAQRAGRDKCQREIELAQGWARMTDVSW
jgi:hypothetical protein